MLALLLVLAWSPASMAEDGQDAASESPAEPSIDPVDALDVEENYKNGVEAEAETQAEV